jgi:phage shock protein C
MQELISVGLTGHSAPFPLSQDAHTALRAYFDEARIRLLSDPDRDEVLRDLEMAIGDRLAGLPRAAYAAIGGEDMRGVLDAVGRVGGEETGAGAPSAGPVGRGMPRGPFFCRIKEGSWSGGICVGLAAYAGFRLDWVRTIALALVVVTGGLLIVPYLVLAIKLPLVPTVADYERLRDSPLEPSA